MEQSTNLYIPVNIRTRLEFFSGYGFAELLPTAAVTLVCVIIALAIHAVGGGFATPAVLVLSGIAASVIAQTKDESGQSAVSHTKRLVRFLRGQKLYKYAFLDEWSVSV